MHKSKSGLSNGSESNSQMSLEQEEYGASVSVNEIKMAQNHDSFLTKELPSYSPIEIPRNASYKEEHKNGYDQIKYTWNRGDYKYTSRWHTRTPGAPEEQGNTWVVERKRSGIGNGPNARKKVEEILVGKNSDGSNKWISKSEWNAAIKARKNGTITKEQEKILYDGHWKSEK